MLQNCYNVSQPVIILGSSSLTRTTFGKRSIGTYPEINWWILVKIIPTLRTTNMNVISGYILELVKIGHRNINTGATLQLKTL